MQTDGGGAQVTVDNSDATEHEGATGSIAEVPEVTEVEEGQGDYAEANDKSEVSDEDFRSIKTVDDSANDFEGRRRISIQR